MSQTNSDTQQQKTRILSYIAIGLASLMALGILFSPIVKVQTPQLIGYVIVLAASLAAFFLARRNIHTPAAILIFGSFTAQFLFVVWLASNNNLAKLIILPFFILQLIAIALIYNSRVALWATFFSAIFWPVAVIMASGVFHAGIAITSGLAILATGSLVWYTMRLLEKALQDTEAKANDLEASQHILQQQTQELQVRTQESENQRREATQAFEKLQQATNERDDLARSLQEATLPIMPVHEHVVVMPLVGAIDTNRAHLLNESLLRGIERNAARVVIIDITGVPLIDTQVAGALLRSAEAARLLGAHTVLVGIRPEVAQTIVGLGLDLRTLNVTSDLQSGIARGMKLLMANQLN